jgi:cysteine desulfuration protein SufE
MNPAPPTTVATRLAAVVDDFADLDGREKLELLLDYAARLAPLPESIAGRRVVEDHRVHECQTPVYLWPEFSDGAARLHAEVAPEAPTVKGFVAILADAVAGRPIDEVLAIRDDLLERMGLAEVLGILRTRGLRAIVGHVKRGLLAASGNTPGANSGASS